MSTAEAGLAYSFVVPVYDEAGNVGRVHAELTRVATSLGAPYEIIFVNDGSEDDTLARLRALQEDDAHLRIVDLDGNFGESAGLSAGFAHARGQIVITMDGDGQNDPADVPDMLRALDADPHVDVVTGFRAAREADLVTRVLPSRIANGLIGLVTGIRVRDNGCSLKVYRRTVVENVRLPRGMHRFLPAILGVVAAQVREVAVSDRPRGSGTSHYGLARILIVLRDLIGLPLVLRPPRGSRPVALALAAAAVALVAVAVLATGSGHLLGAFTALGGAIAALAARYDVTRFLAADRDGVYRLRRVFDGADADSDRDRRRGLLGEKPAADLPRAPLRASDGTV